MRPRIDVRSSARFVGPVLDLNSPQFDISPFAISPSNCLVYLSVCREYKRSVSRESVAP